MDIFAELKKIMANHSKINEKKVTTDSIYVGDIKQIRVRDYLMEVGTILEVDEKSGTFVAIIKSGIFNKNLAIVGLMLKDKTLYIAAYAKEGFINQRTTEKVIQNIFTLIN